MAQLDKVRSQASVRRGSVSDPTEPAQALTASSWLTPPVGTRDLLPRETAERVRISRSLRATFERYGYTAVTTPAFERIDVLERGGTLGVRDVLPFVDADSGEVAVFRPDITPQIARLVATRLRTLPAPYRLAYEGHVVRRPRGRARRQRQIPQAGIELIGVPGPAADAEIMEIAVRALEDLGLAGFALELALVPLARSLIERLPAERQAAATEALARKDTVALREQGGGRAPHLALLVELAQLHGGREVLVEARRLLASDPVAPALDTLDALVRAIDERGLGCDLRVDLGEVRGFGYYTGPSFALLAAGPGEPVGGGGRYDDLLGRFGRPLAGAGFALDLDHLAWALRKGSSSSLERSSIDVVLCDPGPLRHELARRLRASGLSTLAWDGARSEARAWARAWGVPFLLESSARSFQLHDVARGIVAHRGGKALGPSELTQQVARIIRPRPEERSR